MNKYLCDERLRFYRRAKDGAGLAVVLGAALAFSCSAEGKNSSSGNGLNIVNAPTTDSTNRESNNGADGSGNNVTPGNTGATGTSATDGLGGDVCAGANVQASRIKPWVMFIVDRSGSTADAYPGSTSKWQAMYDALMDPNEGVIAKLQSVAYFGMVLFDGDIASGVIDIVSCALGVCPDAATATCPRLVIVNPALDNFNAIKAQYEFSGPGGTTPTALALAAAYKLIPDNQPVLDRKTGAHFAVLCTDGLPNGCIDTFGLPDQQGPIDQLTAAAQRGIKTYVVGVAAVADNANAAAAVGGNAQAYLNELAKYGDTGAPAFSPATKQDLVDAISKIVGGAIGCNVKLNGKVTVGQECDGTVSLNSQKLDCNGVDGWKLVNESEIELQGKACRQFMNDPVAMVNAKFPCGVFVLE
jgi:hypothetical protein